jgi:hypothetical protein
MNASHASTFAIWSAGTASKLSAKREVLWELLLRALLEWKTFNTPQYPQRQLTRRTVRLVVTLHGSGTRTTEHGMPVKPANHLKPISRKMYGMAPRHTHPCSNDKDIGAVEENRWLDLDHLESVRKQVLLLGGKNETGVGVGRRSDLGRRLTLTVRYFLCFLWVVCFRIQHLGVKGFQGFGYGSLSAAQGGNKRSDVFHLSCFTSCLLSYSRFVGYRFAHWSYSGDLVIARRMGRLGRHTGMVLIGICCEHDG